MHRDLGGDALDVAEIVRRKSERSGPDVLLQAMQLRGARDRNNPRLLSEQPDERDLCRGRLLPLGDAAEEGDQGLIRLERLRREPRQRAAEVGAVEGRFLIHLAREKAPAQRAIGNKADSEFLNGRNHFLLRGSRPQRVFALERGDRLDGVSAADRLHAGFGKTEVLDLALLNQFLHRTSHVFDGHIRINPMLVQQVDHIDLEPLERALGGLFDVLRPAVQARGALHPAGIELRIEVEPELGGDHHLLADRSKGLTDEFFVDERTVDLGGVKECDPAFHGCPQKSGHLLLVLGRTVGEAHPHAAEAECRYFQAALAEFAFLHCFSFECHAGHPDLRDARSMEKRYITSDLRVCCQPKLDKRFLESRCSYSGASAAKRWRLAYHALSSGLTYFTPLLSRPRGRRRGARGRSSSVASQEELEPGHDRISRKSC